MVEVGGGGQAAQHEDPFREAGSRSAQRTASLSQIAILMSSLRPHLAGPAGDNPTEGDDVGDRLARENADFDRLRNDAPYVERFLWGGREPDGAWRSCQRLDGAYQAWLRAAGQAEADPLGAFWLAACR